ncbi:MAG: helix-turn-helix transcriptional regulator [Dehalococcoidaceae bacterium]|nr:helix-turn-helix transcriptional regulator [Dehalococcoidaceae bacterium]
MSNIEHNNNEALADIFKALSNPYRLEIFNRLSSCNVSTDDSSSEHQICECVGSLGKDLDIAHSTVSHHLKELKRAGLIRMVRNGKRTECQVNEATLAMIRAYFQPCCCGKQ